MNITLYDLIKSYLSPSQLVRLYDVEGSDPLYGGDLVNIPDDLIYAEVYGIYTNSTLPNTLIIDLGGIFNTL